MIPQVRPLAVAGRFYPAQAEEVQRWLQRRFEEAPSLLNGLKPRALVCPHAGWVYCLDLAALSWRQAAGHTYRRLLFVGPSHYERFEGWAVDEHQAWATPLGTIAVDRDFTTALSRQGGWRAYTRPHLPEHCLEVLCPWGALLFPDLPLVAAVHGRVDGEGLAEGLDAVLDEETLLVVSTDLSHYHDARTAEAKDRRFLDQVARGDLSAAEPDAACGLGALRLLGALARRRGWQIRLLGYHHSGTVSGDLSRVVGYASLVAI